MVDRTKISVKNKIWEMINPFAFFLVCMVAYIFVIYLITGVLFDLGWGAGMSLTDFIYSSSIWCYLAFYAVTIIVKGRGKARAYENGRYGHESSHWKVWQCIVAGAAAFFIAFAVSAAITASGLSDVFTAYSTSADVTFADKSPVLLILTTVIAGPIAEELIFRYMTFGRMRCYIGRRWAIILSAVLFGIYHANIIQFIYCTVIGIVFAFIYDRSGNLWITIGAHMAINLAGIAAYF